MNSLTFVIALVYELLAIMKKETLKNQMKKKETRQRIMFWYIFNRSELQELNNLLIQSIININ